MTPSITPVLVQLGLVLLHLDLGFGAGLPRGPTPKLHRNTGNDRSLYGAHHSSNAGHNVALKKATATATARTKAVATAATAAASSFAAHDVTSLT